MTSIKFQDDIIGKKYVIYKKNHNIFYNGSIFRFNCLNCVHRIVSCQAKGVKT